MVILGRWGPARLTLSVKTNCLTISLEQSGQAEVYSYDYAGRLWTALFDGISYRRGLDGKVVTKWQTPDGRRGRRWLSPGEALEIEERARRQMARLAQDLATGQALLDQPLSEQGWQGLRAAVAFDAERSQEDAARYRQVYKPVGILPPDQYMAVVLQATEGCAFNTCTYCTFYRDRPFRIKTPAEFRTHAHAVREFLGEGFSLRRTIFLGDANALVAPMSRLLPLVEVVHDLYPVEQLGGLFAFLDGFSGEKKSAVDYRRLKELGFKRVYLGLESGNRELLKFLRKPGEPEDVLRAVQAMKEGGLSVGVIVLLGAGGSKYARDHVRDTVKILNAMHLDLDDLLYFSELVEAEGMDYVRDAYQAGLKPLTAQERLAQGERIEAGLVFTEQSGVPHISRYDIREFVY